MPDTITSRKIARLWRLRTESLLLQPDYVRRTEATMTGTATSRALGSWIDRQGVRISRDVAYVARWALQHVDPPVYDRVQLSGVANEVHHIRRAVFGVLRVGLELDHTEQQ